MASASLFAGARLQLLSLSAAPQGSTSDQGSALCETKSLFMIQIGGDRARRNLVRLAGGKEESQEWTDALGPRGFVVFGAFDALIMKIAIELPAFAG